MTYQLRMKWGTGKVDGGGDMDRTEHGWGVRDMDKVRAMNDGWGIWQKINLNEGRGRYKEG